MKNAFIKSLSAALFLTIGTGLMSCSSDSPIISGEDEKTEKPTEEATVYTPLVLSATQEKTRSGAEAFASDFLLSVMDEEKDADKNVMVSPFGVQMLLTMLSNGMDAEALGELKGVFGSGVDELNDYYTLLNEKLPAADNQVKFMMANSLWLANGINVKEEFSNILDSRFAADRYHRVLSTEDTRKEINGWCSEKTNGMIPEFLTNPLDPKCRMFVANAWYFNGKWKNPFDKSSTVDGKFHCADGREAVVKMMNAGLYADYSRLTDGGQVVSLPYGNGSFSLNIYLPADGQDLKEAVKTNPAALKGGSYSTECEISIPKFRLEYKNEELVKILSRMGIKAITEGGHLDGIFKDALINFMQQSTALELTEEGATAAAVTGGGLVEADIDSEPSGPVKIVVDRPFAFSITETGNGITLMSGVVRNPD